MSSSRCPILDKRRCLWKNLSSVSEHNSLPWVVCGDFNEMLHPDEKWGGNPAPLGGIREFKECVERCELADLGFSGQKFTWFNKRADGAMVFERLDRFLANSDWIQCFPDALNYHLPRIKSDHLPLLLVSKVINNIVMNRPFRCERVWIKEPSFLNLAETSWKEARSASHGLGLIRDRALQWNKIFFGNIFQRKKRIIRRLKGISRAMSQGPQPHLVELEQNLALEYQKILNQEEELWASKARLDWMSLGDSNTSFFHASVIMRRRINRISALKDNVGNWVFEGEGIKHLIVNYFDFCFKESPVSNFPFNLNLSPLSNTLFADLNKIPSNEEIRLALWSLKPFKAARFDGFQPGFFQACWEFMGEKICREIKMRFQLSNIPPDWNKSLICLIPKINNPSELKNFRPISLCTTLYKIVSKIIVNRLKPLIGKKGWMVVKLDLEKAYDKLNWSFIVNVFKQFNLPPQLVKLIECCVTSVKHFILINGGMSNCINPFRGIRQGNPLSPYIFILCMEILSRLIDAKVKRKKWTPVKIKGVQISHLLFADDVLIFARTDSNSVSAVNSVLESFLQSLGLAINIEKSSIWFSPNTSAADRDMVTRSLRFREVPKPGKYLGFPLDLSRRISDFKPIVDKVLNKVENWKAKFLSKAGGLGIVKSKERNLAFLAKLCWRIDHEGNAIWAKLVKHYVLKGSSSISPLGRGLILGDLLLRSGLRKNIRAGIGTNFWWDDWIPLGPIRNLISRPLNKDEDNLMVNEVAVEVGSWNWNLLSFDLPFQIKSNVISIACNKNSQEPDISSWKLSSSGIFSLKTAYNLACCNERGGLPVASSNSDLRWIWKLPCYPKIRFFIWQLVWNALPCKSLTGNNIREWIRDNAGNDFPLRVFDPNVIARKASFKAVEFTHLNPKNVIPTPSVAKYVTIGWETPPVGWWKLNIDGSCQGSLNLIGGGGLLRDSNGNWVHGFMKAILLDFSQARVVHIFREGNACADTLAKHAVTSQSTLTYFDSMPSFISSCFVADLVGIKVNRAVK
ncbi:reverse transcriptase [Senna tora]|uniref:Reverse transcriptase n=1 Tax=Senna tora TaxID=362788 RepID=A0A834XBX3_9FABA|nr:reverse transcriptase [Senna tora]